VDQDNGGRDGTAPRNRGGGRLDRTARRIDAAAATANGPRVAGPRQTAADDGRLKTDDLPVRRPPRASPTKYLELEGSTVPAPVEPAPQEELPARPHVEAVEGRGVERAPYILTTSDSSRAAKPRGESRPLRASPLGIG